MYTNRKQRRRRRKNNDKQFLIIGGGIILALSVSILAVRHLNQNRNSIATEAVLEAESLHQEVTILLPIPSGGNPSTELSLDKMRKEEARTLILSYFPWNLQASCGDQTESVSNLIKPLVDSLLDRIYTEDKGGSYSFDFNGLEEIVSAETERLASLWNVSPKGSFLNGYDTESGKFTFSEGSSGIEVDQEKLSNDLTEAIRSLALDQTISVSFQSISSDQAKPSQADYKTLAIFTTKTTSNAKRNTNVKLAANALNGTIVMPGEEFSFNATIGPRTAEKGYQEAAAYSSGEVVQELGGGVCQISSTLYRVAFQAGMEITFRRSHTFEPNYVTPGQDATISWDQPDFRFVNTSSAPIGIRASYSNQEATVAIYGVPVLEEGITWDLYSEKVEDTPIPEPTYVEDQTLEPGTEKLVSAGTQGSTWVTYKVIYKDGVEIDRVKDHEKTYKGHAPVIHRNTSDVQLSPEETTPAETPVPTVDGMPEDYVPESSTAAQNSTAETTAAETDKKQTDASAETTTAAQTSAPVEESPAKETIAVKPESSSASDQPMIWNAQ